MSRAGLCLWVFIAGFLVGASIGHRAGKNAALVEAHINARAR